ncbi:hypothetical protein [Nonomuraea candida]|uniref:hypothetical protein n=1 Tax=Nonomuraea candida TaxID=359159 RepID=UPI0007C79C43|nr:hypothetical protein [Nonomuraea candida]
MSRLGPVITLAAGAALAVGLGVASITATPAAEDTAAGTAAQAPGAEGTAAPSASPSPSPSPSSSSSSSPERTRQEKTAKADYGGRVKGDVALIAISIRNGKAVAYFCDGRREAWFKGSESPGGLRLKGVAGGGSELAATLDGGRAEGRVSVGGRKWDFTAPAVVKPSGLYRATALVRGARLRAGWIVIRNPDGGYEQVGAAFAGEERLDIPRLDGERPTAPVTIDGTTVTPEDVDGFIEEMR